MSSKKQLTKSRGWCLTYFPTDEKADETWFKNLSTTKGIRYFIVGREICPQSRKLHFQGYISFKNAKTFKNAKKWFGLDRIHIVPAKGNDKQNETYCSKDADVFIEIGKPLIQGKRTDIARAIEILKETSSVSSVLETVQNYQAVRHAELYLKYKEKKRPIGKINVIWIYGSSGKGKTRKVYDDNTDNDIFTPTSYKWWEGYDGQEIVLIDDIRRDFCKFHELLKLLDIYPFRVETKGGSRQAQFHTIYITAPSSPEAMWGGRGDEEILQLTRRITQTIDIDNL